MQVFQGYYRYLWIFVSILDLAARISTLKKKGQELAYISFPHFASQCHNWNLGYMRDYLSNMPTKLHDLDDQVIVPDHKIEWSFISPVPRIMQAKLWHFGKKKIGYQLTVAITIHGYITIHIIFKEVRPMMPPAHKPHQTVNFSGWYLLQCFWLIVTPKSTIVVIYVPIEPKIKLVDFWIKSGFLANFLKIAKNSALL